MTDPNSSNRHALRRHRTRMYALRVARGIAQAGRVDHVGFSGPHKQIERALGLPLGEVDDFRAVVVESGTRPTCPHHHGCHCHRMLGWSTPRQELREAEAFRQNNSPMFKVINHHVRQRGARLLHRTASQRAQKWKARK